MNTLQSHDRKFAGFMHSGCAELLLVAFVLAALLNLAMGNWGIALAMLLPLAALFIGVQYVDWRCRCQKGDEVQVVLGPHTGVQGTIVGRDKTGASFTVKPSNAECVHSVTVLALHLTKVKRTTPVDKG